VAQRLTAARVPFGASARTSDRALLSIVLHRATSGVARRMDMEIAAVLMLASVVFGIVQQFDTARF